MDGILCLEEESRTVVVRILAVMAWSRDDRAVLRLWRKVTSDLLWYFL